MPPIIDHAGPTQKANRYRRLFEAFGVVFTSDGVNARAEECPFCQQDNFYVNTDTGEYVCHSANTCGEKGNAYTFIRRIHADSFEQTKEHDELYRPLKERRGLPLQTLKRHRLAWNDYLGEWLIPFCNDNGEVKSLTRYDVASGRKMVLPGLTQELYGLDQLRKETNRPLFVLEGPWDAIAADHHFRQKKTRDRFDILAVPSATIFREEWTKYLANRTVRICLDNDKAGQDGQQKILKLCRERKVEAQISVLKWPAGTPDKYDVTDLVREGGNLAEFSRSNCIDIALRERRLVLTRADKVEEEPTSWLWRGHVTFGTFASLAGVMGTQKSTIARDIAARATVGKPMPGEKAGLAPFDVAYFTSEDSQARVRDSVRLHGGDLTKLHLFDLAQTEDPLDILDCLGEFEEVIRQFSVKLVVLDALNSFIGGDISTDSKARRTVSGRLQALARRTGACIIGIRNFGKSDIGTGSQRVLGAASLSDVARVVMNTNEVEQLDLGSAEHPLLHRRFELEFEKVSDAPLPAPLSYHAENLSTGEHDSHYRRLVWTPHYTAADIRQALGRKKVAQKGSGSAPSH